MRDPPFAVVFGVVATREIEKIHDWLLINRGFEATKNFTDVLDAMRLRLGRMPESGHPVRTGVGFSVTLRRVGLAETGYWLYYRLHLQRRRIRVLRCRHEAQRPLTFSKG
jgi:plasmid stabilization system protein ParE